MSRQQNGPRPQAVLKKLLRDQGDSYQTAILYSLVIGVLSLASTFFMLEVYDRVVNSRNSFTLFMLLVAVVGAYVMLELLELVRHGILEGVSQKLDQAFSKQLFNTAFEACLLYTSPSPRDLSTSRMPSSA